MYFLACAPQAKSFGTSSLLKWKLYRAYSVNQITETMKVIILDYDSTCTVSNYDMKCLDGGGSDIGGVGSLL